MHASTIAVAAAALAAPALAQTHYSDEAYKNGNSFSTPNTSEEPVIGEAYTVKWTPTIETSHGSCQKVSIDLLHGADASSLVVTQNLATDINNVGSFSWTPAAFLDPAEAQYGLRLTCSESGDYQYTVLFGIKKGNAAVTTSSAGAGSYGSSSTTTKSGSSIADATQTSAGPSTVWTTDIVSHFTTYCPAATTLAFNNVTYTVSEATTLTVTDCPCTVSYTEKPETTAAPVAHTPYPIPNNGTTLMPVGSASQPASVAVTESTTASAVSGAAQATSSTTMPAGFEGAASGLKATALGAFVAVAVAVLAL